MELQISCFKNDMYSLLLIAASVDAYVIVVPIKISNK